MEWNGLDYSYSYPRLFVIFICFDCRPISIRWHSTLMHTVFKYFFLLYALFCFTLRWCTEISDIYILQRNNGFTNSRLPYHTYVFHYSKREREKKMRYRLHKWIGQICDILLIQLKTFYSVKPFPIHFPISFLSSFFCIENPLMWIGFFFSSFFLYSFIIQA